MNAHIPHLVDRLRTVFLHCVRNGDDAGQFPIFRKVQAGLAFFRQMISLRRQILRHICRPADEIPVAPGQLQNAAAFLRRRSPPERSQTVSGHCPEVFHGEGFCALLPGPVHHRPGQRVLTLYLQRAGQSEQLFFCIPRCRNNIRHNRFSGRDGSGFVQGHRPDPAGFFQGSGGLEQNSVLRPQAVSHHDSHRRRQTQCTRTADHQHTDASGQGVPGASAQENPDDRHSQGRQQNRRNEDTGNPVCDLGDRRLGGRRITDHLNDLGQGGIPSHPGRPGPDIT